MLWTCSVTWELLRPALHPVSSYSCRHSVSPALSSDALLAVRVPLVFAVDPRRGAVTDGRRSVWTGGWREKESSRSAQSAASLAREATFRPPAENRGKAATASHLQPIHPKSSTLFACQPL
jgi:hypothetical protein